MACGVHFRCSTNLQQDPQIPHACGEVSCMEVLALLDPCIKEEDIWSQTHHHQAYVISEWILFIVKPPQSAPVLMAMEMDKGFDSYLPLAKQVMELDFGSSKEEIFEAVCKGYNCWVS